MDLILWRHAQAEDEAAHGGDLARVLTKKGEQQAARMADWLRHHLPREARILCSPARRCQQTARALGRPYDVCEELGPGRGADELLEAAGWPSAPHPVVIVGHQPTLGAAIARVLRLQDEDCSVRKGAVWWLQARERAGREQATVLCVQSPDLA